uniref:GRAM domain-containing protein n=1 Tax=Gossypium raimondii TaxID=29730 RepID=A0A0D2VA81_GOSRA|nr:hypothetical protein B456_013G068200 [Gossypium raimondii]
MNHILEQVIGVPMKSTTYQVERTPKRYLPNSAGQHQVPSSVEGSNIFRKGKGNVVLKRRTSSGRKLIPSHMDSENMGVNESENMKKTSQKYMEIVTVDDFQFWFMGFLNYHKAFKYLQQAIISQRLLHDVLQVTFKVAHYVSL